MRDICYTQYLNTRNERLSLTLAMHDERFVRTIKEASLVHFLVLCSGWYARDAGLRIGIYYQDIYYPEPPLKYH